MLGGWTYDEKLNLATGRGGRKIVGLSLTRVVEENIRGNEQMAEKKQLGQAESRENPVGPE
jgi:hypothetical protein